MFLSKSQKHKPTVDTGALGSAIPPVRSNVSNVDKFLVDVARHRPPSSTSLAIRQAAPTWAFTVRFLPLLLGIAVALQSLVADVLQTATILVLSETAETCPTTDSCCRGLGINRSPVLAFHAVADILASVLRAAGALPAYGSRHRILAASARCCPHLPLARRVRPFRLRLLAPSLMPHSVAYRVLCTLNTVIGNGSRHCVDAS